MSGVDWMVRHGRSLALAIAVKAAPDRLCGRDYGDAVMESIMANATADRVSRRGASSPRQPGLCDYPQEEDDDDDDFLFQIFIQQ